MEELSPSSLAEVVLPGSWARGSLGDDTADEYVFLEDWHVSCLQTQSKEQCCELTQLTILAADIMLDLPFGFV